MKDHKKKFWCFSKCRITEIQLQEIVDSQNMVTQGLFEHNEISICVVKCVQFIETNVMT